MTVTLFNRFLATDYRFSASKPFSGHLIYNPYAVLPGVWGKANFHAHARAYGGLTNGKQVGAAVVDAYLDAGYRIAGISDYFRVNPDIHHNQNIAVPVFEHGLNPIKAHQIVIGADEPVFEDIFLFQNDHSRQFVLKRLSRLNAFVCIAHPRNRNGFPASSLSRLSDFDAVEIFSGPHAAIAHWDSALSAGRAVWAMANDDIHDVNEARFGRSFNLLPNQVNSSSQVLDVLRKGEYAAVQRHKGYSGGDSIPPMPVYVTVSDSTVEMGFDRPFRECRVIGKGGIKRFIYRNGQEVCFRFSPSDTYLRVEVDAPGITAYFNPFFRSEEESVNHVRISSWVDHQSTLRTRILLVCLWIMMCLLVLPSPTAPYDSRNSCLQYFLTYMKRVQRVQPAG